MTVQTVLFPREKYSEMQAKAWLLMHGYRTTYNGKGVHKTKNYLRYRQLAPDKSRRYYVETISGGIKLVHY